MTACLDKLTKNLMNIANAEEKEDIQKILAQEIEIPTTGEYNIEQDPDWFDINDYMSE